MERFKERERRRLENVMERKKSKGCEKEGKLGMKEGQRGKRKRRVCVRGKGETKGREERQEGREGNERGESRERRWKGRG